MLPVQSLETVEHYMGFSEESETQQINRAIGGVVILPRNDFE